MDDSTLPLPGRVGEWANDVNRRITEFEESVISRLTLRQLRIALVVYLSAAAFSVGAAAQSVSEFGEAVCGTGIGVLAGLAVIGLSMYLLIKALIKGMMAFDKSKSQSAKRSQEGRSEMSEAAKTGAGAFLPAIFAGVFEVMGINMVSCMSPGEWSIVGAIVFIPV